MKLKIILGSICLLFTFSNCIFAQTVVLPDLLSNTVEKKSDLIRPRIYQNSEIDKMKFKSGSEVFALEKQGFLQINRKRLEAGLEELIWNDNCAKVARIHSDNMAKYKFFGHTGIDGKMVNDRADSIGLSKWRAIGENIAYNFGYQNPLETAVEGWMKSPSHHDNILDNRWKESAIGIAISADGAYYFTQVFLLRK